MAMASETRDLRRYGTTVTAARPFEPAPRKARRDIGCFIFPPSVSVERADAASGNHGTKKKKGFREPDRWLTVAQSKN
jgi:hypothetical protein